MVKFQNFKSKDLLGSGSALCHQGVKESKPLLINQPSRSRCLIFMTKKFNSYMSGIFLTSFIQVDRVFLALQIFSVLIILLI